MTSLLTYCYNAEDIDDFMSRALCKFGQEKIDEFCEECIPDWLNDGGQRIYHSVMNDDLGDFGILSDNRGDIAISIKEL